MIQGQPHLFGHNLNADMIHPPQYFSLDRDRVAQGLMMGVDPGFLDVFRPGDIIIAGRNFACGSSRETTVRALIYNDVAAIVAVSFARIFYRSAVNRGLPIFEFANPREYELVSARTPAQIDESRGLLMVDGGAFELVGVPPVVREWLQAAESERERGGDL